METRRARKSRRMEEEGGETKKDGKRQREGEEENENRWRRFDKRRRRQRILVKRRLLPGIQRTAPIFLNTKPFARPLSLSRAFTFFFCRQRSYSAQPQNLSEHRGGSPSMHRHPGHSLGKATDAYRRVCLSSSTAGREATQRAREKKEKTGEARAVTCLRMRR